MEVRSSKLKFKGEKTKKKRKRENDEEGSSSKRRAAEDLDPGKWVLPEEESEIRGPTFIFHPSDPSPISINFNSTTNKIVIYSLDRAKSEEDDKPVALLEHEPRDVAQVWVVTRIAGSSTINIRTGTGEGKFISCDKHGIVTADRDARGPQEEWTPELLPEGMVAFKNVYDKYLSVDEVAGGNLQLRGDSEEVGFSERFWVKIQHKYKLEAHEERKKKQLEDGLTTMDNIDESGTKYDLGFAPRFVISDPLTASSTKPGVLAVLYYLPATKKRFFCFSFPGELRSSSFHSSNARRRKDAWQRHCSTADLN